MTARKGAGEALEAIAARFDLPVFLVREVLDG